MKLYICEKPSQAKDIAAVLGNPTKEDGYIKTDQGIVTYCFGHLIQFVNPDGYDSKYTDWNFDHLPILPDEWISEVKESAAKQYRAVSNLIGNANSIVIATDADREGEMIAREILDKVGYEGPIERLWISSMDEKSILKGLQDVRPGESTEPLYQACLARSKADWLVGMNLTRAATTKLRKYNESGVLSIGRVQTPTLNLVVTRDLQIENFTPIPFYDLEALVKTENGEVTLTFAPKSEEKRIFDKSVAEDKVDKATGHQGPVRVTSETKHTDPPKLFSLSGFQKEVSSLFGWSASEALEVAQALYETHKATTYPRTDCPFLPQEQESDVPQIVENLKSLSLFNFELKSPEVRKSVFNTKKVTAHHAIIPTTAAPDISKMSDKELKGFKLIASRYIANLMPKYTYQQTKLAFAVPPAEVEFSAVGNVPASLGWRTLEYHHLNQKEVVFPPITDGDSGTAVEVKVLNKKTSPPKRYTEGTLIADMEAVAKYVEDPALKRKLKENAGIGTEATRANIIETLKEREFLVLDGKSIISSKRGRNLVKRLKGTAPQLVDPGRTALWEEHLEQIANGENTAEQFIAQISGDLKELILRIGESDMSSLGNITCPVSNEPVTDKGSFYLFPGKPEIKFWKRVGELFIEPKVYVDMLSSNSGKSQLIKGFTGQSGKKFSAFLKIEASEEKIVYDFEGVPKAKKKAGLKSRSRGGGFAA